MKNSRVLPVLLFAAMCLWGTSLVFGQYSTADQAIEFINSKLSHSYIQKVDKDGKVIMNTPDDMIRFNIREASFNYNGLNGDARVRVFCDYCLEYYDRGRTEKTSNRQSFLCKSEKEAYQAIDALKFLKKIYLDNNEQLKPVDKKILVNDSTLKVTTVSEAISLINENLSYSMISKIDDQGIMVINSPDETYKVDLKRAEFMHNDLNNNYEVRIYGDYCIEVFQKQEAEGVISRKSFQTKLASRASKVIRTLYYLKAAYSGLDYRAVPSLRNVTRAKTNSYNTISEAINYINDRLTYSIIMEVDKNGLMSVNAPDNIYRFIMSDVHVDEANEKSVNSFFYGLPIPGKPFHAIVVECNNCIREYDDVTEYDREDEQVFQCTGRTQVKEVVKAFSFIQEQVKAGKR